jgi:hypothetical protein
MPRTLSQQFLAEARREIGGLREIKTRSYSRLVARKWTVGYLNVGLRRLRLDVPMGQGNYETAVVRSETDIAVAVAKLAARANGLA